LKSDLAVLQNKVVESSGSANMINVDRNNVLECFVRAFARHTFDPFQRIDICFVDVDSNTEGAIDSGGPSREFFRILLQSVVTSNMFEGPENFKHISLCTKGLCDWRIIYI